MISITLDDGNTIECEILTSFYLAKTNKEYAVYTDNKYVNDKLNIYAICKDEDGNTINVTEDSEWKLINNKMKEIGFDGV